ncbi:hypothetical protein RV14_GL000634 [Enterococcus ratti]|uniref:Uncharacterized protein n=1 Tax=Enterococcus ratti TaxID=150033 RepID=A0A1L8WGV2_9ENTE|nr:hypothetical protein RV14_GL000634 [Enterococcus ratti]
MHPFKYELLDVNQQIGVMISEKIVRFGSFLCDLLVTQSHKLDVIALIVRCLRNSASYG